MNRIGLAAPPGDRHGRQPKGQDAARSRRMIAIEERFRASSRLARKKVLIGSKDQAAAPRRTPARYLLTAI